MPSLLGSPFQSELSTVLGRILIYEDMTFLKHFQISENTKVCPFNRQLNLNEIAFFSFSNNPLGFVSQIEGMLFLSSSED